MGAGIVGLAVARELLARQPGRSVAVLEREPRSARTRPATTRRHPRRHLLRAGLAEGAPVRRGRAASCTRTASEHGIAHERCGKLIVALDAERAAAARRARAARPRQRRAGPAAARRATRSRELEPHVARRRRAALARAPAIVDFGAVARVYAARRRARPAARSAPACAVERRRPARRPASTLRHARGRVPRALRRLLRRRVVGPAGRRRRRATADPRIVPFRGAYLRLRPERRDLVRALVYPVPDPALPFLGVHLTRTHRRRGAGRPHRAAGRRPRRLPPARVRPRDLRETLAWPGTWRMARRWWRTGLTELRHAAEPPRAGRATAPRYVPELTPDDVLPGPAGVRAQALGRDGSLVDDFVVSRDRARAPRPQRPLPRRHVLARARAADRGPRRLKVLVTGHDGYIGTVLTPLLLAGGPRGRRARHQPVRQPRVRRDRRSPRAARPTSATSRPRTSTASTPSSTSPPSPTTRSATCNPRAHLRRSTTTRACALARRPSEAGVPRFLFSSLLQPLRRRRRRRRRSTRTRAFNPVTPYGESKVLAEQRHRRARRRRASPPSSCATPPPTASRPRMRGDIVVNNLVAYAYTTGEVRMQSDGTPWRPLVHVEDISRAVPRRARGARARRSTTRRSTSAATRTTTRSATSPGWSSRPPAPA